MPIVLKPALWPALALAAGGSAAWGASDPSFAAAVAPAMDRMMEAMHVPSTGDADRDFVRMMIPHHQGAIDMAVAQLRFGKNERVKRIAQEIIISQQQEIAAMRMAVGEPVPPSAPAPTQPAHAHGRH